MLHRDLQKLLFGLHGDDVPDTRASANHEREGRIALDIDDTNWA